MTGVQTCALDLSSSSPTTALTARSATTNPNPLPPSSAPIIPASPTPTIASNNTNDPHTPWGPTHSRGPSGSFDFHHHHHQQHYFPPPSLPHHHHHQQHIRSTNTGPGGMEWQDRESNRERERRNASTGSSPALTTTATAGMTAGTGASSNSLLGPTSVPPPPGEYHILQKPCNYIILTKSVLSDFLTFLFFRQKKNKLRLQCRVLIPTHIAPPPYRPFTLTLRTRG